MSLVPLLIWAAPLLQAQDSPGITIDRTASFRSLTEELRSKSGEKFTLDQTLVLKEVTVKVRNAGFYAALDALCRAHGGATYQADADRRHDQELLIEPGTWVEFPSSYSGDFKIALTGIARFRTRSEADNRSWVRAHLVLLAPPSAQIPRWGADSEWTCLEAVDASGVDVRPAAEGEPEEAVVLASSPRQRCAAGTGLQLRDFDLSKGLKRLSGKVSLSMASMIDVRVPLEPGRKVETPEGTITVQSVDAYEKSGEESTWRIALEYRRRDKTGKADRPFDTDFKVDDQETSYLSGVPEEEKPFEVRTWRAGPKPKLLTLRARTGPRSLVVPFHFDNLTWKADK